MLAIKTIHLAGIKQHNIIIKTFTAASRQKLIYELNTWFFDYFYANQYPIKQLPPIDDWKRSTEDATYWSIKFPDDNWEVWIRHELMEFQ